MLAPGRASCHSHGQRLAGAPALRAQRGAFRGDPACWHDNFRLTPLQAMDYGSHSSPWAPRDPSADTPAGCSGPHPMAPPWVTPSAA